MTVTTSGPSAARHRAPSTCITVDHRRRRGHACPRARWSSAPPSSSASQIPRFCDHPLLEPVGACRSAWSRSRASPSRRPRARSRSPTGMVVKTQVTSEVAPTRRSRASWSSCSSTTRSTARSATRAASARCRTRRCRNGRGETRFDGTSSAPSPSRSTSPRRCCSTASAACSCARCTRFSEQIAGDPFIELLERGAQQQVGIYERRAVRVLLLRQHRADLPGRRAHQRAVPLPRPPVRPGVHADASASTAPAGCALRTDHRRGTVLRRLAGDDPEVNEEWNCDKGRFAFALPRPRTGSRTRWSATTTASCVAASWPEALAVAAARPAAAAGARPACSPAAGSPLEDAYAYAQVRPRRARHQRHRLPGPRRTPPRRPTFLAAHVAGRPRRRPTYADLETAPGRAARRASSPRTSRRSSSCGCARRARTRGTAVFVGRAVRHPRPRQGAAAAARRPSRRRGRGARRAGRRAPRRATPPTPRACCASPAPSSWSASASRQSPGALSAAAAPGRAPPAPGSAWVPAPRRRARRARRRCAAGPAARRPPARRRRRPRRGRRGLGRRRRCADRARSRPCARAARRRRGRGRADAGGELGGARRRRRRARRPRRPRGCLAARRRRAGFVVGLEMRHSAVTERRRRRASRSPRSPRRPARSSTGRAGRAPFGAGLPRRARRMSDARVLADARRRAGRRPRLAPTSPTLRAELAALGPVGRRPRRPRRASPPPTPADAGDGRGRARHLAPAARRAACCRTASRTSPAPPAPPVARLSPATAAALGVADGDRGHGVDRRAARSPCRWWSTDMPDGVVWLPAQLRRAATSARRRSAPAPRRPSCAISGGAA